MLGMIVTKMPSEPETRKSTNNRSSLKQPTMPFYERTGRWKYKAGTSSTLRIGLTPVLMPFNHSSTSPPKKTRKKRQR